MNKTLRIILIGLVAIALLLGGFSGGFVAGQLLPFSATGLRVAPTAIAEAPPTISPDAQAATPSDLQTLFKPFWEAWQVVHENYVDQPVNDVKLMQGAIKGMVEALGDKHSSYMDPQTFKDENDQLTGEYEGIGAFVDTSGDFLTIISPIAGSPAEQAGLLAGDQIIAVNGHDMTGVDPELVRRQVIGPAGTTVKLTIAREGESKPLEFEVTRQKISVPSAEGKMLDNGIAYVQVTTFGDNTTKELIATLKQLMAQHPKGLILDLRNNGGGYLQTAVEVASQFIDSGVILYEQYGNGSRQSYEALGNGLAAKIPMVVLINEGTASASEIVAGALQDYGRAKLVGVTSYGKGSVQTWVPLSNDQGAVRVTIAKWLTPKGRTINEKGLTPDVVVEMTADDRKAGRDPQLDKALEVLLQMLSGDAAQ